MYEFAVNPLKLQRAIAETTEENGGKTPAEEIVEARYVKLGGLLEKDEEKATDVPRRAMKAPDIRTVRARKAK